MELSGVTLRRGDWSALVLPSFGANLIDLQYRGKPILRTPHTMEELEQNPCLYGNPLLLPANRTADGRFAFAGREYTLPINEPAHGNHLHGRLHSAPFTVTERTDTSLRCVCRNTGGLFPIPFTLEARFALDDSGMTQTLVLGGEEALPVMLGLHTTFLEPKRFSVPIKERREYDKRFLPTGRLLPLTEREERYRAGCTPQGEGISGFFTSAGRTAQLGDIRFSVSEGFNEWVLYNGGGASGFLCVEPQSAPVNGLNMKNACQVVPAGGTVSYCIRFLRG